MRMKSPRLYAWLLLVVPLGILAGLLFAMLSGGPRAADPYARYRTPQTRQIRKELSPTAIPSPVATTSPETDKLARRLIRPGARPYQATLAFRDAESYQAFLQRAASLGLRALKRIDALHTVLVGFDSLDGLAGDIAANA